MAPAEARTATVPRPAEGEAEEETIEGEYKEV